MNKLQIILEARRQIENMNAATAKEKEQRAEYNGIAIDDRVRVRGSKAKNPYGTVRKLYTAFYRGKYRKMAKVFYPKSYRSFSTGDWISATRYIDTKNLIIDDDLPF